MARGLWFDMTPDERRKRAARHAGGGMDKGCKVVKPAPKKERSKEK